LAAKTRAIPLDAFRQLVQRTRRRAR
jgi:hypothetical protein